MYVCRSLTVCRLEHGLTDNNREMNENENISERMASNGHLILKTNFFTSFFALGLCPICILLLDITQVIPIVLLAFGILNTINIWSFSYHKDLVKTYYIATILTSATALIIILYSGGINSPFIFSLALIVVACYIDTNAYGWMLLIINYLVIIFIYTQSIPAYSFTKNVIPEHSKDVFALLSILFFVYISCGIFGKNLLQAHHKVYKAKNSLQQKVKETENLLREVHHRVKNNLQTVSSLLSMQARNSGNKETKVLLKSSQNRVISMAMVHEMLYMREDISKIDYESYVQELCEYLVRTIKGTSKNITLNVQIKEIKLNIDTAIPLGILINEIVTNSLKYGIQDESKGTISVLLTKEKEDKYILDIKDTGKGYTDDINYKTSKSLGLKLIHNLARQLQGSVFKDNSSQGTHYIIKFKEIKPKLPTLE